MEQKINIAEILKDAPIGTKLYSPMFGEIPLIKVNEERQKIFCDINITFQEWKKIAVFNKYGQLLLNPVCRSNPTKEVMLFPSIHHGTWRDFSPSWKHKHFEPFQKILVSWYCGSLNKHIWHADLYSHFDKNSKKHFTVGNGGLSDDKIFPYEGNEDKLGKPISGID